MTKAVENDELFVWPWKAVVANIPVQWKNGLYVGESGSQFRNELIERGYNPIRVHRLWNKRGHTGYAVVEFKNDGIGLSDALRFEKDYGTIGQGKRDYYRAEETGDRLYCWVARDDDFYSRDAIGDFLRKNGDQLKTRVGYQKEEEIKNGRLVASLSNQVEAQDMRLKDMEEETPISQNSLITEKDETVQNFNEGEKKQKYVHLEERDRMKMGLEMKPNKLNQQEENGMAVEEQRRVDERVLKLADDHRREKENLQRKTTNQALELEIKRLTGKLKVVKHMGEKDDEDASVPEKVRANGQELTDKEGEVEYLDEMNEKLIVKERRCNDELQEDRKELIDTIFNEEDQKNGLGEEAYEAVTNALMEMNMNNQQEDGLKKRQGDEIENETLKLANLRNEQLQFVTVDGGKNHKKEEENIVEYLLDAKQALEMEIKSLTGQMQVVKHRADDEDASEKLRAIDQELKDKEEELEDLLALIQNLIVKELIDESSETTEIVYVNRNKKKMFGVSDGRTTRPPNDKEDGVFAPGFRIIKRDDSEKIYVLKGRYILLTSGKRKDSHNLKKEIENTAIQGMSVNEILNGVNPGKDSLGMVILGGYSDQGSGGVEYRVGNSRGRMRGFVFTAGKGGRDAASKFLKLNALKPFDGIQDDDEVFSRLRICVGFSSTRSMSSGGLMNEAMVHDRHAEIRPRRHVIEVLIEHLSEMELGLAKIYNTGSPYSPIVANRFIEKWRKEKAVDRVVIIGICNETFSGFFKLKNEFPSGTITAGHDDDDVTNEDVFYPLTVSRLEKIWNQYRFPK